MKKSIYLILLCWSGTLLSQEITIYQTSAAGDKLKQLDVVELDPSTSITVDTTQKFQHIIGFGGAFTESSAHLYTKLGEQNQKLLMDAYFSKEGADYSLCRTHINSSDFSLKPYAYVAKGDATLNSFDLKEEENDVIPMIQAARKVAGHDLKLIASPWTAPPWYKDNNEWRGGKLKPGYQGLWARYISLYLSEMEGKGLIFWGLTPENEPLGNNSQWESMVFTTSEMADFMKFHLGPVLRKDHPSLKILGYDQNKGPELTHWSKTLLRDSSLLPYLDGMAVHWYDGTKDWFGASLDTTHALAPDKMIIQTEACIDSEKPRWNDDDWYWKAEATDWGYEWAPPEDRYRHPPYVPVYRYARDIIGSLNHHVAGWVDWNMLLDREGGPNSASNWCVAPVIADTTLDSLYFTPLYYTLKHFSAFINANARRIFVSSPAPSSLLFTAVLNPDKSIVLIVLNQEDIPQVFSFECHGFQQSIKIDKKALQTIVIKAKE